MSVANGEELMHRKEAGMGVAACGFWFHFIISISPPSPSRAIFSLKFCNPTKNEGEKLQILSPKIPAKSIPIFIFFVGFPRNCQSPICPPTHFIGPIFCLSSKNHFQIQQKIVSSALIQSFSSSTENAANSPSFLKIFLNLSPTLNVGQMARKNCNSSSFRNASGLSANLIKN